MTSSNAATPLSALESAIADGQAGRADPADVINLFLSSKVYLPSASNFSEGSDDYHPVVFPHNEAEYIAVFTTLDRINDDIVNVAPYAALITGANAIRMLASNVGLVVNPGNELGFEIIPETVASIQEYLASLPQDDDADNEVNNQI